MASSDKSIKIHEHCLVPPPSAAATPFSVPLTFFDLHWLRFHPVERIFFYSLPLPHSDHSSFFDKVVPKLKTSLSHTLQHFLPLAGNIVWPSDSPKPIIQFNPGDGVSLVLAQCDDALFNHMFFCFKEKQCVQPITCWTIHPVAPQNLTLWYPTWSHQILLPQLCPCR